MEEKKQILENVNNDISELPEELEKAGKYISITMKRIIEKGDADKVFCRYNTNLSIIDHRGTNLFHDVLVHFKGYNVCASIDAPGDIGEYLRSGLDWKKWLDNFKQGCLYKEQRGDDSIVMDITLTLPGLFAIEELTRTGSAGGISSTLMVHGIGLPPQ